MVEWVSYQGKPLGKTSFDDTGNRKLVFVAEGLEALATLFSLKPTDQVETEGRGTMTYEKYKQDTLSEITGFYPNTEAWLLKNYKERTIRELDSARITRS